MYNSSGWRTRYNSSECSDILTPRTKSINVRTLYPQELSDQLRAVRRTVFILRWGAVPCYIEQLIAPHVKLMVAGNLDLALFTTTHGRASRGTNNAALLRLVGGLLGLDPAETEICLSRMFSSEMKITEVYDTLFRWMGETKVLIETVGLKNLDDLEKLVHLQSCFPDARFVWETSDPRCCRSQEELSSWLSCHSTIYSFLAPKHQHTWIHVTQADVINNNKDISEVVTECIGVFVSRHYDRMWKSLSKFVENNPPLEPSKNIEIVDEQTVFLTRYLGYPVPSQNGDVTSADQIT